MKSLGLVSRRMNALHPKLMHIAQPTNGATKAEVATNGTGSFQRKFRCNGFRFEG